VTAIPQPPVPVPVLLRDREVATLLGVSRASVWKLVSEGVLPKPIKLPGTRSARWRREAILEAVDGWEDSRC
jgi:predicted DNA-binding transcriptional regulator AlpA